MDSSTLALWSDLSIIWLVLLTMLMLLVPGVAFFFALRGVRYVNRWLRLPLLNAHLWALRIEDGTHRASRAICQVPIKLYSTNAQVRVTVRGVIDYMRGV
jgi:hypothetical protein